MDPIVNDLWIEIYKLVQETCEGCENDYLNQQGHICVMNTEYDNLVLFFDRAFERVHGANAAYLFKQNVEIQMYASLPGWSYTKAKTCCDYSNTPNTSIEISSEEEVIEISSEEEEEAVEDSNDNP